jgi:XTP/dITP diphosphohydrolase
MIKLVIATHNKHKLGEIKPLLPEQFQLLSLDDVEIFDDIPETSDTLEGNALQKASFVFSRTAINCFADDTGLEVDALDGRPGVYSARYAGEGCSYADNNRKLLDELKGIANRKACFRTVICLIWKDKEYYFEGKVEGSIISELRGNEGFGYDPVFIPDGHSLTYAEMGFEEKNSMSHRAESVRKLREFLLKYESLP